MAVKLLISRMALGIALAGLATTALPVTAVAKEKEKEKGGKITFSPAFTKVAADLDKTVSEASKNPAVTAASEKARNAQTPAAKQAATAEVDAALGGGIKEKLAAAAAAASTPGDKVKLGELTRNVGVFYADPAMQHQGLVMMLDSGAIAPDQMGQIQYLAGVTAYQTGDHAGAIKYLKPAMDSGYKDPQGMLPRVLADAYKRTGNNAGAMEVAQQEIAAAKASGAKPSEDAIRTALQAAYDAKNLASAADLSAELARDYPSPASWATAAGIVRALGAFPDQENLDLMRLMARTNAMQDKRDYLEYIQNADPRRLPGEALKVIDAGTAAGKLTAGDVADYRQLASTRLSSDRASLSGLERDARAGGASGNTVAAAADAFLSYDEPAKAEELYKIGLGKPGIDKNRVLTRLGIAQVDQGKYAEARQTFAQVSGVRAPIAKLWIAYADTKSGGPSAAQATQPPATASSQ